jgi:uncharacterized membrane protein
MTAETALIILAAILVLVLAASTAKAASDKGCSATLWFIAGVLLPGLALVVALFLDEQSVKECPRCALALTGLHGDYLIFNLIVGGLRNDLP